MNRLKAAGAAIAGVLLVGAAIVAVHGLPGGGASSRTGLAADVAPHAGSAQGLPANAATICAGCTSPFKQDADTLDSGLNGGAVVSADVPAAELDSPQAFASARCCGPVQPLTTGAAGEANGASGDNVFAAMPFSALASARAAMHGAGVMAGKDGLFDGGDAVGVASGSGSNGNGAAAPAGGVGDATDDVLASINPDSGERAPVSESVPYCINPAGVYCGGSKETDGPSDSDTSPEVVTTPIADPTDKPREPDLPGETPLSHEHGLDSALNDVPEPFTLALIGIGLASFRAARRS